MFGMSVRQALTSMSFLMAFFISFTCTAAPKANPIVRDLPAGLSATEVQSAVLEGCGIRGWACKVIDEQTIEGSIWVRGKHYVKVDIFISESSLSIRYSDSENMKYNAKKNTIHKGYISWTNNLLGDISNILLQKAI